MISDAARNFDILVTSFNLYIIYIYNYFDRSIQFFKSVAKFLDTSASYSFRVRST